MRVAGVLTLCCLLAGCVIGGQEAVPLRFKFVTSGQSSDLVSVFSQTIQGNSLRPLAPANVRGTRDSEGNLLIEWTRRARIGGGLRPFSEVPLAEETEHYEIDILDGSNNVLRTIVVDLTQGVPAVLVPANTDPSFITGNDMAGDPTGVTGPAAYTLQQLDRVGSFVEARLTTGEGAAQFGVLESAYAPQWNQSGLADLRIYRSTLSLTTLLSPPGLTVYEKQAGETVTTEKFTSGTLGVNAVRVRIEIGNSGTKYYWDYTGDGSVPFYVSDIPVPLPAVGVFKLVGASGAVDDVFIGQRVTPSAIYDVEKQTHDFGSVQSVVRVRVYQVSAVVGRGPFTQADL